METWASVNRACSTIEIGYLPAEDPDVREEAESHAIGDGAPVKDCVRSRANANSM